MKIIFFIGLGGFAGAISRYTLSKYIFNILNPLFPWGTFYVNIIGCFFIGLVYQIFENMIIPVEIRNFISIGFLGAFTTFSTYSLETVNLINNGEIKTSLINILSQNIAGILLVYLGIFSSKLLIRLIRFI
ncbi:MAG: fluoride efflux transporter CrcB [Spirochaetia bacterium]|nr:fluoride efflux transporter CrcB [Spirochaetia bacterium]